MDRDEILAVIEEWWKGVEEAKRLPGWSIEEMDVAIKPREGFMFHLALNTPIGDLEGYDMAFQTVDGLRIWLDKLVEDIIYIHSDLEVDEELWESLDEIL